MPRKMLAALAAALGLALSGCASGVPSSQVADPGPGTGDVPAGMETFYEQDLTWYGCQGLECAQVIVPLDHDDPDGETIQLTITRLAATGPSDGVLLTNPGGPGVSGLDHLAASRGAWSRTVRSHLDIVSFDPRGVGSSTPVRCLTDEDTDTMLGSDPTPEGQAEQEHADEIAQDFAAGCLEAAGDALAHFSTVDAAKDIDVIRAVLGADRINYLGSSYGTHLGSTYAALHPGRVGRFVLDAPVSPTVDLAGLTTAQAAGLDATTREWARACIDDGCPFGGDEDEVVTSLHAFLDGIDAATIRTGDGEETLTEGWATWGVIAGLVSPSRWAQLTTAIEDAEGGDGADLMGLASDYVGRTGNGYSGNMVHAIHVVNCLDREPGTMPGDREGWAARMGTGPCEHWPVETAATAPDLTLDGTPDVLVIGATGDPITPYPWAVELKDTLGAAHLLAREGSGHVSYLRDRCVTKAVDRFLVDGQLPDDGTTCGQ